MGGLALRVWGLQGLGFGGLGFGVIGSILGVGVSGQPPLLSHHEQGWGLTTTPPIKNGRRGQGLGV